MHSDNSRAESTPAKGHRLGVVLGSSENPARVGSLAQYAENLGFEEVWLPEDLFFRGGIATAGAALASTDSIGVGLGVVSAVLRHPAVLAMEIACLEESYPRRLRVGIGLGNPRFVRRLGLLPGRPLRANRECLESVRELLSGHSVSLDGHAFRLDDVRLAHYPENTVPLYIGATGPKMLALSGEVSDGTVLGLGSGIRYVRWAHDQIVRGMERCAQGRDHRIVTYVLVADGRNPLARENVRNVLSRLFASMGPAAHTDAYEVSDELRKILGHHTTLEAAEDEVKREMPDSWLDDFAVIGDADECAASLQKFFDAGSDAIAIIPSPGQPMEETLRWIGEEVAPRLVPDNATGNKMRTES